VLPVELVRNDTLLVGLQAIDGLETVPWCEEARLSGAVVRPPVCRDTDDDSHQTEEEVNHLVAEEGVRVDATKAIYDGRTDQGAETVAAVPARNAKWLL
jgi:hypothetical protein